MLGAEPPVDKHEKTLHRGTVMLVGPGPGVLGHCEGEEMIADLPVECADALTHKALATDTAKTCGC